MPLFNQKALTDWFAKEKRDFPWRQTPTPYGVWISEVMLQQTQASVVVPYFERWMGRFPSIRALAEASQNEVLKMWEGLGYYSRARHLHAASQQILREFGGELPRTRETLGRIKGIGPYTQGAILSFAFHQKAPAVDGNVLRVLSRYFRIEEPIESAKARFFALTEKILPENESWVTMEALIELGAQICRKKPLCEQCPIKKECKAHLQKVAHLLPNKRKRPKSTSLERSVIVLICEEKLLVGRVEAKRVMEGLYEFPYIEKNENIGALKERVQRDFKIEPEFCMELPLINHSFTRYHATLYPSVWRVKMATPMENFEWVDFEKLLELPFSSGHKKILQACASYIRKVQRGGEVRRSAFLESR